MINDSLIMSKMLTKISKGFQVTIPADWRAFLGLRRGSPIEIDLDKKKKQVVIEPLDVPDFKELFKEAKKFKHNLSIKDLQKLEEDLFE